MCDRLTATGAAHLARLTALQTLRLPRYADDEWLAAVGGLATLTRLDLDDCRRVSDAGIERLSPLTRLTELDLKDCRLTDRSLATVGRLVRLEELNLSCSDDAWRGVSWLTDAGVKELRPLTALKGLCLNSCTQLTDESLAVVAELPLLEALHIYGCGDDAKITDQGFQRLAKLENSFEEDARCWWLGDHRPRSCSGRRTRAAARVVVAWLDNDYEQDTGGAVRVEEAAGLASRRSADYE